MSSSWKQEADISGLVSLHEQVKEAFWRKEGIRLTYAPFFLHALINSLKAFPQLNAQHNGGRLEVQEDIHLAMAMVADRWPVVTDAGDKSIAGFAVALHQLWNMPKHDLPDANKKLPQATFPVNLATAFGYYLAEPVIRSPYASFLTIEWLVPKAVAASSVIRCEQKVSLQLLLDPAMAEEQIGEAFLQSLKAHIEGISPRTLLY